MNFDVTSFGEAMLRLSVAAGRRLSRTRNLEVNLGGAESNVLTALAALGRRCGWVSRVPDTAVGDLALWSLKGAGVDVSSVERTSDRRQGLYYVEFGSPPRPTEVIYDREASTAASLTPDMMPWSYLFSTRLLHLTGITPALSDSCREACGVAVAKAVQAGVPICFDVNYRAKLWTREEARDWLSTHLNGLEILICGRSDAERLFDLSGTDEDMVMALSRTFAAKNTILTLGSYGAIAVIDHELVCVKAVSAEVKDRLGAGDAFAAGVIDGWLDGQIHDGLRRGAMLASLALAQHGDMLVVNRQELDRLLISTAEATQVNR